LALEFSQHPGNYGKPSRLERVRHGFLFLSGVTGILHPPRVAEETPRPDPTGVVTAPRTVAHNNATLAE
jgi:hypothetical protein